MNIIPVDEYNDLFTVVDVVPQHLVDKVLATDWLSLPWRKEKYQEQWNRRRIEESSIPWFDLWTEYFTELWPKIIEELKIKNCLGYSGTAFWLDMPGFFCPVHTDGPLTGSLHLTWIGDENLGTTFYHTKAYDSVRKQFDFKTNNGYIMLNPPPTDYQHLQWHGMIQPVPENSFRLTTYSIFNIYHE